MSTVAYYRRQAAECRKRASLTSDGEEQDRLLQMAKEWDRHADEREAQLRKEAEDRAPPSET
jgi:hypothetical protein